MKKLSLLLCISFNLLFANNSFSQDDANSGIIIDGVKTDTIKCWSFDKMELVFPITDKYKKYEKIQITLYAKIDDGEHHGGVFFLDFSPQSFSDAFEGGRYGVWHFLKDKKTDAQMGNFGPFGGNLLYKRNNFAKMPKGHIMYFDVKGFVITGYYNDAYGNKVANYGNGSILYSSEKIPMIKCKFNESAPCNLPGKKLELKIEKSPAYREELGIIK